MRGRTEPPAAIRAIPVDRLAWGFPQAGGGFGADGVLRGALLPPVVFGTFGRPPTERERAVRQAFREAGFRLREHPDFRGWLWIHFVSDAGLHAQGLRLGSPAKLAGATGDLREALLAVRELLPLLQGARRRPATPPGRCAAVPRARLADGPRARLAARSFRAGARPLASWACRRLPHRSGSGHAGRVSGRVSATAAGHQSGPRP
ncbi:ketopantoate reductase family protein [Nonomuraea rubra]